MKVLLDLDGVLADFHNHWYSVQPTLTRPEPWPNGLWSLAKIHDISFELSCKGLDIDFWRTIPWMEDGKEILASLEEFFGKRNICILTSNHVTDAATAAMGKVQWIERELPDYNHRYFLGAEKEFLAHKDVLLIDDKNENVDSFRVAGGSAFLLPRPWNRSFAQAKHSLFSLENFLHANH